MSDADAFATALIIFLSTLVTWAYGLKVGGMLVGL